MEQRSNLAALPAKDNQSTDFDVTGTSSYSEFIHLSRYSRWLEEEGRRESWEETVERYISFFVERHPEHEDEIRPLGRYIREFKTMPSMRALMTAGPALKRDEVAGYNCAYLTVDHPRAFDETMYILMCVTEDTWVTTSFGPKRVKDLINRPFVAQVRGEPFFSRTGFFRTGERRTMTLYAEGFEVTLTDNHPLLTKEGDEEVWKEVKDVSLGDQIVLSDPGLMEWDGAGTRDDGYLLGYFIGDGNFGHLGKMELASYEPEEEAAPMRQRLQDIILALPGRSDRAGWSYDDKKKGWRLIDRQGANLALSFGLSPENKRITPKMEGASSDFCLGVLRGVFDADGSVLSTPNNRSIILKWVDKKSLQAVQRMLARFDIQSKIKKGSPPRIETIRGEEVNCQQQWVLFIRGADRERYADLIGFENTKKHARVSEFIRRGYKKARTATVTEVAQNEELITVYDVQVEGIHAFDANGLLVHNCGTGVGFSVERQYISKLPEVAEEFHESDSVLNVKDSRIGWSAALRELISLLYNGQIPKWNLDRIREAGARLKTFGGRASGPEPLNDLFKFCVSLFSKAAGRKLSSIECHDLVCKIAEIVVVGGVRRSALLSLSNLSDDRMRRAKSGQWFPDQKQRQLANNSACYTERPDFSVFLAEWTSLFESKSGERGIFSRVAAQQQVAKNGRRDPNYEFGTNPCCVGPSTIIMTGEGPRYISDLDGRPFKALVNGVEYDAPRGSWCSGEGDIYRLVTDQGYELELTPEHRILCAEGIWKEAKDLRPGDNISLHNHSYAEITPWSGEGSSQEGYLLGSLVGDGNFMKPELGSQAEIKVWHKDVGCDGIVRKALACAVGMKYRRDWSGWSPSCGDYRRMSLSVGLPQRFGMDWGSKTISKKISTASYDFQRAFLQGLFDADGHIEGDQQHGYSVRLGWTDPTGMKKVQQMLSHFGVKSVIGKVHDDRKASLPDGRGGYKQYDCKACYRLIITSDSIDAFSHHIDFSHDVKKAKLKALRESVIRYKSKWTATVKSFDFVRRGEVWDAEVLGVHAFDANGIYAHNSEIILRPDQLCNLSEVVLRSDDSIDDILDKIRVAAILGTLQSTLTKFRYLRRAWRKNTQEERLLGVSLTGIMDHPVLGDVDNPELPELLERLRDHAVETNRIWAEKLGIPQSTAVTCVKPSGTLSQLVNSSSGIHARFSPYYIRRVRIDKKQPLADFMVERGFPHEEDVGNPGTLVFEFPIKSPENSVVVKDVDAIQQLRLWTIYQNHWCEHKPSCTVYYKDENFLHVGAWIWDNFDKVSGLTFYPHSDAIYPQAPYEEIEKEEYLRREAELPSINWADLSEYEDTDHTEGAHTLACSGGLCEAVDLVQAS